MSTAIFARLALLDALRGGLPWLAAASAVLGAALAAFLSQVAVTESVSLQAAVVAAVLRACAVFLVVSHVASSTARELSDKTLEFTLALPLSRASQYLGRLAGFVACAVALAIAFALPLLLWASPAAVALWGLSLACEAALAAAIALFFSMTLTQLVPAIAATLGLYVLARAMAAIQLIASGPLTEPSALSQVTRFAVDAVALLLPRLDAVTRTEWLLYGPPSAGAYCMALASLAAYALLVIAAGLFDFHRRSL